jgi:hypothetical protein
MLADDFDVPGACDVMLGQFLATNALTAGLTELPTLRRHRE